MATMAADGVGAGRQGELVVIGDSEFLHNKNLEGTKNHDPANTTFLKNLLDSCSDDLPVDTGQDLRVGAAAPSPVGGGGLLAVGVVAGLGGGVPDATAGVVGGRWGGACCGAVRGAGDRVEVAGGCDYAAMRWKDGIPVPPELFGGCCVCSACRRA